MVDIRQSCLHAFGLGSVAVVAHKWIEPDDASGTASQTNHCLLKQVRITLVEAVAEDDQRGVGTHRLGKPGVGEFQQASADAGAPRPVLDATCKLLDGTSYILGREPMGQSSEASVKCECFAP